MKELMLLIVLLMAITVSEAAPLTFKCTTAEGDPAADLVVDTTKRVMAWGAVNYTIRSMNDRYISAYSQGPYDVGGEVFVFNRIDGEYLRAGILIAWNSLDALNRKEPGKLTANTWSGKCSQPLL